MLTRLLSSGLLASVLSLNLLPLTASALPLQTTGGRSMTLAQRVDVDPLDDTTPVRPQQRLRPGVQRTNPAQLRGVQPAQTNRSSAQRTDYTGTYRARVRDGNISMDVLLKLNSNGSAEMQTDYPDYEPLKERGNWRALNDGSVLVILTEIDGQTAETFNVLGFRTTSNNQLVATVYDPDIYGMDRLTLRKEGTAQNPGNASDYSGTYTAFLPTQDTPGMDLNLILKRDGSAQMTTDYMDNEEPLLETGTWRTNRDGSVSVVLDKLDGQPADPANVLRFRVNNSALVATSFDPDIYGSQGLTLRKQR